MFNSYNTIREFHEWVQAQPNPIYRRAVVEIGWPTATAGLLSPNAGDPASVLSLNEFKAWIKTVKLHYATKDESL